VSENQVESPLRDERRNVEINVGKSCNNKCVFCLDGMPSNEDKRFIDFEAMRRELARWREQGHLSVGFLGGEPTTYPKIAESIACARDLGYTRIAIATNAMMFRREKFADELIAAGLTRVTISMHGHTAALEDKLTAVPGGFEKKCRAIRVLKERQRAGALKDGLSVNIVLNGWNYRALPKMLRFFFEELGLSDVRVNFIRPEGYAVGSADLVPTLTEVVPVLMKGVLLNEYHFKKDLTFAGVPFCVLPTELLSSKNLLARYVGDVYRDLSTDCSIRNEGEDRGVSRVENGRARFNWQDRKRYDLKDHPRACESCALADTCEGVWRGYLDIYGEQELSPLLREAGRLRRRERVAAAFRCASRSFKTEAAGDRGRASTSSMSTSPSRSRSDPASSPRRGRCVHRKAAAAAACARAPPVTSTFFRAPSASARRPTTSSICSCSPPASGANHRAWGVRRVSSAKERSGSRSARRAFSLSSTVTPRTASTPCSFGALAGRPDPSVVCSPGVRAPSGPESRVRL
jgi:MoaA/NifB/PqqE/SkfB family radical SAM enzyme